MARDFRADRARFFEIVGSGSSGSAGPGLAIFSASSANASYLPGYTDSNIFSDVGNDVFLFVSGSKGKRYTEGGGATLFGGDVVVSGTLYAERQVIEVDEAVTGSLWVSGSLMVSQSIAINGWNGNTGTPGWSPFIGLHFTSDAKAQAIAWDGLDGVVDAAIWEAHDDLHLSASRQVVILSSSEGSAGATSLDNRTFADTNFFVSGAIGSRGTLDSGTSCFGGDVHVSGNINIGSGGSLTGGPWTDEGPILRPSSGENVGVGGSGNTLPGYAVSLVGTSGDVLANRYMTASMGFSGSLTRLTDGRSYLVQGSNVTITSTSNGQVVIGSSGGGSSQWTRLAGSLYPNTPGTTSVIVGDTGIGTSDHVLYADGRATFNQQKEVGGDFIVKANAEEYALLVKAASNQVMILSGGSAKSNNEAAAPDVAFYVSGSRLRQNLRGVSLFGGEVVTSGSISIHGAQPVRLITGSWMGGPQTINLSGSIMLDGLDPDSVSAIVWDSSPDTNYPDAFIYEDTGDLVISSSRETIINARSTITLNTSGSTTGSVHYLICGKLDGLVANHFNSHRENIDFRIATPMNRSIFLVDASEETVNVGRDFGSPSPGPDTNFYVSGAIKGRDSTAWRGVSTFGGDLLVSGVLVARGDNSNTHAGTISGSIHHTSRGKSYLVAGSGINIVSGTDGQVTITGTATSAEWYDEGAILRPTDGVSHAVGIGGTGSSISDYDIFFKSDGETLFNIQQNAIDFTVRSNNKDALMVSGSTDQVLILSGGAATSVNEASGADVSFYVSGAVGSKGTSDKGTAVFGGDTVVSGALFVAGTATAGVTTQAAIVLDSTLSSKIVWDSANDGNSPDAAIYESTGDLHLTASDSVMIQAATTIENRAYGGFRYLDLTSITAQKVAQFNLLNADIDFRIGDNTSTSTFWLNAAEESVNIGRDLSETITSDIKFYVSGTSGSMGTVARGTSLFTGDLVVSGNTVIGSRQDVLEQHTLEISGSTRSGAGTFGRLEYIYGCFSYDLDNSAPRFIPLPKSYDELTFVNQKKGSCQAAITMPHDGTIREIRLVLSGANGNTINPGNTQIAFYTSTGATANVDLIDQAGSGLTFAAPPTGFVRALSPTVNITNDDGQSWLFNFGTSTKFSKDRVMLMAIGFTNGPNTLSKYHCTYTCMIEYNEFS